MLSAELFAGCGGLALGMSHAGFRHQHMAEFDLDAVANFPALHDGYSWEHYPWLPGGYQANSDKVLFI